MSPISPRATAALLIVGALVVGFALGVAGDHVYLLHSHRLMPSRGAERFVARRLVEHLDGELHLSPQQKTAIQQIIDRHRLRIDAISASVRPQIRQELEATSSEIETVLNPEQRVKFRDLSTRMRQRHMHGMRPGMAPPPQPR